MIRDGRWDEEYGEMLALRGKNVYNTDKTGECAAPGNVLQNRSFTAFRMTPNGRKLTETPVTAYSG